MQHWADFGIILVLLVMNAVVGFWEEYQAGKAIAALKAQLALRARVKRGGAWTTVPARELVPGDLIRLRLGDIVPADARLLDGDPIEVDQSALTGESLPVTHKTGRCRLFRLDRQAGRDRRAGLRHGPQTYFGKTARLVETAHTVSHFQRAVLKIGDYLIVIALVLVVLILTVALFRGDPDAGNPGVRPGPDRGGHPGGHADGAVGHDGGGGPDPGRASRPSSAGWSPSRNWPAWTCSVPTRPAR